MDLAALGSEISTNSLFELLTVYTAVPTRLFATWSELRVAVAAKAWFGWPTQAKGGEPEAESRPLVAGGRKFPASLLVSSSRLESSAPRWRQCWCMKLERDSKGFERPKGFGDSMTM